MDGIMRTGDKSSLRREALERRALLGGEERERAAILLAERILGHQWYYLSDTLLGFASCGTEIDTREILADALKKGKRVFLPRVEGDGMEFYRVRDLSELRKGYHGIPEPAGDSERFAYEEMQPGEEEKGADGLQVLMLMPGVAFDAYRNRIGYGKGFYDRYLRDREALQLRTVAVGFACQMVPEIPAQEHDIRPCQVICV